MSKTDIPIHLDLTPGLEYPGGPAASKGSGNGHLSIPESKRTSRRRLNSQSQVVVAPKLSALARPDATIREESLPPRRKQAQYFVTLLSLNDTFVTRHVSVPYFPDTRKLGRPTGTKIKPDVTNGFFDSRVLSRNHAVMYINPANGKLMLKDLGSSNGTYVNNAKLDLEPVEVKLGDNICFGFNIQVGINHKQISCKIENITVMNDLTRSQEPVSPMDSAEYKHYQYIQDLYQQISLSEVQHSGTAGTKTGTKTGSDNANGAGSTPSQLFESALFSDINPDIEDGLLGLYTKANNGIFKNSGTVSSTHLENTVNLLMACFTKLKQHNASLASIESFLLTYHRRLDDLNAAYLNEQMSSKFKELNDAISSEKHTNEKLLGEFKYFRDDNHKKIKKLEEKVFALKDEKLVLSRQLDLERRQRESEKYDQRVKLPLSELTDEQDSGISAEDSNVKSTLQAAESDAGNEEDHHEATETRENPPENENSDHSNENDANGNDQGDASNGHPHENGSNNGQAPNQPNRNPNDPNQNPNDNNLDSIPAKTLSAEALKQLDEDTDLRYNQNFLFLACVGLIFGFIIHHNVT